MIFILKLKLRIKDLREDHDLTQKEISEIIMCNQFLYSKYERGQREIPLSLLITLTDYHKTNLDYSVYRIGNPNML